MLSYVLMDINLMYVTGYWKSTEPCNNFRGWLVNHINQWFSYIKMGFNVICTVTQIIRIIKKRTLFFDC